jgi:hypothetical protein
MSINAGWAFGHWKIKPMHGGIRAMAAETNLCGVQINHSFTEKIVFQNN